MFIKAMLVSLVIGPSLSKRVLLFFHCHIVTHFIQQLEHFSSEIESKSLLIDLPFLLGEISFRTYVHF